LPRSRSRKGISDIVANLLIMTMVVALFTMVILWAGGYLGQSQGIWNTQSQRAQEAIVIESVNYASGNWTVYARNVGTSKLQLNILYIDSLPHSFDFYQYPMNLSPSGDGTVLPRQLVKIVANVPLGSGSHRLQLVTTLGADAAFIYVIP